MMAERMMEKTTEPKSIESDEHGVHSLDVNRSLVELLLQAGDKIETDNKDGILTSVYNALGSGMTYVKELLTQSTTSTVRSETDSLTSKACPLRSSTEIWSRSICKSCSSVKDSLEWTTIEPESMTTLDHVEYSTAVEPGSYECRYTGLRWKNSCQVELEYHVSDWEQVSEFLQKSHFQPCGPLMDITVVSGELTAVHLPHFLCLGSSPSLQDEVRVLHVEDSGVSLERCELSRFGAELLNPTFSPKGVLVRRGFPVKAHCEVLLYCTSTAHLTLHVYVIPTDPKMLESVQKQENGSIRIAKPKPDFSLQMKNRYTLSTSCPSKIRPENLKLRYTSQTANFFEVYIKDAKDDFQLFLKNQEKDTVWEVDIRSAEYSRNQCCVYSFIQSTRPSGIHFVDIQRKSLIQRVKLVEPIADDLYPHISEEKHSKITNAKSSQDKMRAIYDALVSGGQPLRGIFLQSLQENEPDLVRELSQSS